MCITAAVFQKSKRMKSALFKYSHNLGLPSLFSTGDLFYSWWFGALLWESQRVKQTRLMRYWNNMSHFLGLIVFLFYRTQIDLKSYPICSLLGQNCASWKHFSQDISSMSGYRCKWTMQAHNLIAKLQDSGALDRQNQTNKENFNNTIKKP